MFWFEQAYNATTPDKALVDLGPAKKCASLAWKYYIRLVNEPQLMTKCLLISVNFLSKANVNQIPWHKGMACSVHSPRQAEQCKLC